MPQALAAPKRALPAGSPRERLSIGAVSPPRPFEPRNESLLTMRRLRAGTPPGKDLTVDSAGGLRLCFAHASR